MTEGLVVSLNYRGVPQLSLSTSRKVVFNLSELVCRENFEVVPRNFYKIKINVQKHNHANLDITLSKNNPLLHQLLGINSYCSQRKKRYNKKLNHLPFSMLKDLALTRTTKLPSGTFSVMLA